MVMICIMITLHLFVVLSFKLNTKNIEREMTVNSPYDGDLKLGIVLRELLPYQVKLI